MKATLAIVVIVFACVAAGAASSIQSPQQSPSAAQPGESVPSDTGSQQQGMPAVGSKPCSESKDTCEIESSQQPATAPGSKTEPQSAESKPSETPSGHSKKSRHHKRAKKQLPSHDPSSPKKIVVRQGSTSDPNVVLTPGATARGSYSPQMTAELLSATDANLREASSKPLTATQEETVNQIKLFMEQANAAVKAGDLDRGHNLAMKAHLLSDDLVKH
jgi:hypothetical protein